MRESMDPGRPTRVPAPHAIEGVARPGDRWQARGVSSELAPGLIAAAPSLQCPFFNHTLVLLVDHGEQGTFGFCINKASDVRFRQVLSEVGLEIDAVSPPEAPVLVGGPVSPETGWIVFDPREGGWPEEETIRLGERVAVSASMKILESLAAGEGPRHRLMTLGYAGWGPGQLEAEMKDGAWIPVEMDPALVFDAPMEERWSKALRTLGIDPAWVSSGGTASA